MRKVFVTLLITLAVLAAGTSVWVLLSKPEETLSNTVYDAIPLDAGLIVDIRNYSDLCRALRNNDLWNTLGSISTVGTLDKNMMTLDSIVQTHEQTMPFLNSIIFSVHPVGKDEMQSIGYIQINSDRETRNFTDILKEQLSGIATLTQRQYDLVNITDVTFNSPKHHTSSFSYASRNGTFIFSRSSILLENAVRQTATNSKITDSQELTQLKLSAGKNTPANIYVNYSLLPRTALTILHAQHSTRIEALARLAEWTEFDLNLKPDMLILSGFTASGNTADKWLTALQSQPPVTATLTGAIPSTAHTFLWLGIRQIEQYFADCAKHLEQNKKTARKKELERIKTTWRIDLQTDFAQLFENEAALIYAHVGQTPAESEQFALFRIKSASAAATTIKAWQNATAKNTPHATRQQTLTLDSQLTFTAYRLPFNLPETLFGETFAGTGPWCVIADNTILCASSPALLQKYLYYTAFWHSSLQTDANFSTTANLFSAQNNLMLYINPALAAHHRNTTLNPRIHTALQPVTDTIAQIQAITYQINTTDGKLYSSLLIKHRPTHPQTAATTAQPSWQTLLDTAIATKPQLVKNHNSGQAEIFVQDRANNIYLINSAGRILWKQKLTEPIISPIHQIDIYRNGKLQFLFNTATAIHAIDRLGNPVTNYPLTLPSPAAGSLALFDYDTNRQYRILIACQNRKIYAYDRTGTPVTGWRFTQSEHPAQTPITHIRVSGKDYITFADKYRIYILDRQGRTRVTPQHSIPVAQNTEIALDRQRAQLALTDTAGTVHLISLATGRITRQIIKPFPAAHTFTCHDIDGDGQGDYIFTAANTLSAYRHDATPIFTVETSEPIPARPNIYEFSADDTRIGIVQPISNTIWLFDHRGNTCAGFPLPGSTSFSIGRIDPSGSGFNLFTGSTGNFLHNYSVSR